MKMKKTDLPYGWEIKKLKDIGRTQTGTTPKTSVKENYGDFIPFIKPADVDFSGNGDIRLDNHGLSEIGLKRGRKIDANSILMVCIGATIGKVGFTMNEISCNQQINTLTVSQNYEPKFLYYAMTSKAFQDKVLLEGKGAQATLPIINKTKWENLTLPFPKSRLEQQRIVSILDHCFEAIDKAKANAEQNLQNAKELFESYLQGVFEKKGDGWEKRELQECFRLKSGDGLTSKMMNQEGEFHVYGGNGIAGLHDSFNLSGNNVIIGRVGALCGNARHITEEIWLTDNAFKVMDMQFEFDNSFLTYLLNFKNLRNYARQAAQPVISNSSLKSVVLNFPKVITEQQKIVQKLDTLKEKTESLEKHYQQRIDNLEELKKSILQKAFAGELKTEKMVEEIEIA